MKWNMRSYLGSIILSATIFLISGFTALAQGPNDEETTLPVPDTSSVVTLAPSTPGQVEEIEPPPLPGIAPLPPDGTGVLNLSLAGLDSENLELNRDGQTAYREFFLPNFIQVLPGTTLDIDYGYESNATNLTPEIIVEFNNVDRLAELQLTAVLSQTTTQLNLDGLVRVRDRNRVRFSLNTQSECGGEQPNVRSIIYNSTTFRIPYQLVPMQPDLSRYPRPFSEKAYRPIETYIVLPANPTSADLSAAATIGAGLGKFGFGDFVITSTLDISVTNEILQSYNLIIIGKPNTNLILEEISLPLALDNELLEPDYGIIQEIQSPWNPYRMLLVVSGQTDRALARASQALNRNIRFPGMSGPVAIIQDVLPPIPEAGEERGIDLTFAELGMEDEVIFGADRAGVRVDFFLPRNFELLEEPQLFLAFNHSQLVDSQLSSLDVFLNEVPVGATILDESNIVEGLLKIDLPVWLLESGRNTLTIEAEMHLNSDETCGASSDRRLWTVIRSSSFLRLPYQAQAVQPTLGLFPYPFDQDVNLNDVSLVVPPRPNMLELQKMIELAARLGSAAGGDYIALEATTADRVTREELSERHTILIGRPSRNNLLRAINDQLPQPFAPDSDLLEPALDSVVLLPDPNQSVGLLQEIGTPGLSEHYILVVSGTTDEAVGWAADAILPPNILDNGNVAIVKKSGLSNLDASTAVEVFSLDTGGVIEDSESRSIVQKAGFDVTHWLALGDRWW